MQEVIFVRGEKISDFDFVNKKLAEGWKVRSIVAQSVDRGSGYSIFGGFVVLIEK